MTAPRPRNEAGPPADPRLFFFLSFAGENDRDEGRVERFFRDLCEEVRVAAGTRRDDPAPIGFLSIVSLRLGSDWSAELAYALGNCHVFLALCAPAYFQSRWCGAEWQVFADRLTGHRRRTDERAPSLFPVCWMPMAMPPVAAGIQFVDRQLSEPLTKVGLRQLMRLDRYRDDYAEFVSRLAALIVTTTRRCPLPPTVVSHDYDRLPYAFPGTPRPPVPIPRPGPANDGTTLPNLDQNDGFPHLHNT